VTLKGKEIFFFKFVAEKWSGYGRTGQTADYGPADGFTRFMK